MYKYTSLYNGPCCRHHQLPHRGRHQRCRGDHHRWQPQQLQPDRLLSGRPAHLRAREQGTVLSEANKYFVSQERISDQKIFPVYLKIFGCRWSTRNVSTCPWWMTAAWCWPARTTASTSTDTSRCRPSASRYLDISGYLDRTSCRLFRESKVERNLLLKQLDGAILT